jgi:hypothetical protein
MTISTLTHHVIKHHTDELHMRHKYWFDYFPGCDGISASANMDGFTVLNAIKMRFGWDTDLIRQAADTCNEKDEIAILDRLTPKLFIVPRTKVDDPVKSRFYMTDLLAAADAVGIRELQFSHYSFTDHLGFKREWETVLEMIYYQQTTAKLDHLVLDIDARIFRKVLRFIRNRGIRKANSLHLHFHGDQSLLIGC